MNAITFQEEASKLERGLYRISWSMLSNNEDCADAVQETLYKAWQNRDSLRNKKAFRTWITRILINTCNDMLKQRNKRRWVSLKEEMAVSQPPEETELPLNEALERLSPEHRTVVVLYYVEGYKVREIADMLCVPAGTVKSRLMYARSHIKQNVIHSRQEQGGFAHEKV